MEGSDDIIVNKFSISMGGKTLFKDSKLSLVHGRRYGLIGVSALLLAPAQARGLQARGGSAQVPAKPPSGATCGNQLWSPTSHTRRRPRAH